MDLHEFRTALQSVKAGSVGGPTGTTREHYTHAPDSYLESLLPIMNDMLRGIFPDCQRLGVITPIGKDNYRVRPIALLETLLRVVDTRVNSRNQDVDYRDGLQNKHQHGFGKGGAAADATAIATGVIEDARDTNQSCAIGEED